MKDLPNYIGMMSKLVRLSLEGNQLTRIRSSIRTSGTDNLKKYLLTRATPDETNAYTNMDLQENNSVYSGKSLDRIEDVIRSATNGEVSFINMDLNKDFNKDSHDSQLNRDDKLKKADEQ